MSALLVVLILLSSRPAALRSLVAPTTCHYSLLVSWRQLRATALLTDCTATSPYWYPALRTPPVMRRWQSCAVERGTRAGLLCARRRLPVQASRTGMGALRQMLVLLVCLGPQPGECAPSFPLIRTCRTLPASSAAPRCATGALPEVRCEPRRTRHAAVATLRTPRHYRPTGYMLLSTRDSDL